jgi:hypothetical protein
LYIPQSLVWFGKLPSMDRLNEIRQAKINGEKLQAAAAKAQLEQLRMMGAAQSGIVGARMAPQ